MTLLNENFLKELQRMSELAGISKDPINEGVSQTINAENKILKEDDEDLLGDIEDLLDDEAKSLGSQTKSVGKITKDLKTAMVLNNISQYEAVNLDLSGEYEPQTSGAKPEAEGGIEGTIYTKTPAEKLSGGKKEFNRLKSDFTPEMIEKLRKQGLSQEEINAVIHDKNQRSPVTFGQEGGDVQTAKWQPRIKDASVIKTQSIEKNGKMTIGISGVGKEQLEFLQRMLSDRPLPKNGDKDVDIEEALLSDWPYKDLVIANAEHIIRDFFNKAIVGIIKQTLKRNVNAPKDSQFTMFIENGVDHALAQSKRRMYNQDFNNFGAWFMQVVKNKVIDQLKSITDYVFDTVSANQRFFAQTNPLVIDSKLNPDRAIPGEYKVTKSPATFNTESGDGGFEKNNFFRYTFNDPREAASLFTSKAESGKLSPFRSKFLRFPNEFYKSVPKEKPGSLTKTTYEPGDGGFEEQTRYEGISGSEAIKIAKTSIDNILDEIVIEISNTQSEEGGKVKIMKRNELFYGKDEFYINKEGKPIKYNKNPFPSKDFKLTSGNIYEIIKKAPTGKNDSYGNPAFIYTIKDDEGKEVQLSNRYAVPEEKSTSTKGLTSKTATEYKDAVIETMRILLQYGKFIQKYSQTVYFKNGEDGVYFKNVENGKIVKINPYNPATHLGGSVKKNEKGITATPFKNAKLSEKYNRIKDIPIISVWTSDRLPGNTESIIGILSKIAIAKNIELPIDLFDQTTKQALYKTISNPAEQESLKKRTEYFILSIREALKKFFGAGTVSEKVKKDRNYLKDLLMNFEMSSRGEPAEHEMSNSSSKFRSYDKENQETTAQLTENHIRKVVRELMNEKLNKK